MRNRFCGVLGLLLAATLGLAGAEDQVLSTKVGDVDVDLFMPGDVPVLHGLFVHAANYSMKPNDRWAEGGRPIGFGHVALNLKDVRKATNRPKKLRTALDQGLKEFAEKSGHKELLNLPFAGTGHSAGGLVTGVLLQTPERTLTLCIDCGWISDPRKFKPADKSIPMLFTLGAIPDAFKMLPGITNNFVPARQESWLWGLGLQHGCAHDFGNTATLMLPWMQAVVEARLPQDWNPLDGPPKLRDMKLEEGWLGDRNSIDGTWAVIAPYAEYKGDKTQAAWLPNRATAYAWRAWQSKDAPVVLEINSADGKAKLAPWTPKSDRTLMVNPGIELNLGVTCKPGSAIKQVEYFDGDRLLGAAKAAPWQLPVKNLAQGAHAVSAIWHDNSGNRGAVNPALVVVRKSPAN